MFWFHKCGTGYGLQCRYDGQTCSHSIAHYSVDTDPDFLPDAIASANSCFKLKELFDNTMQAESRYFGPDRSEQAAYRQDSIDDLYARARAGDKVSSQLFMTFLTEGVQEFKAASEYSYVPDNGRVPELAEHYVHQQLTDLPVPIYRPQIMVNAKSFYPISEEEQFQLLDIYRNALASKSPLSTGHKRTEQNVTASNMTSLTLGLVSLNLGHINRQPIIAGAFKFDKWIREQEKAPPSSDYTDMPEIPAFEDALGSTTVLGPDESILVLNGRLDVQDMQAACDTNINADCMLMISLSYGKQSQISLTRSASQKATADGVVGSAFADEVLLQDSERPKYLQNIDLGLKDSDQAAHSPLVLVAKLHCQRNLRTRSDCSDQRRRGRRFGRPQYQAQDDEKEEVEVEEEEEENEPVGRLRSTTPSSGARLHGRDDQARGSFENTNRVPVAPPKTPPIPPPRRRERSVTPPGRNTQRRVQTHHQWTQNADGSWFDRCPEFPWQSIYYHQPTWQRRNNELWLYGLRLYIPYGILSAVLMANFQTKEEGKDKKRFRKKMRLSWLKTEEAK
eukprot:s1034_g13.t1